MSSTGKAFDVVILGGGSAAEAVCGHLQGRRMAVVEELRVGGECPFVACIPSKSMLAAARRFRVAGAGTGNPAPGGSTPRAEGAFAAAVAERDRAAEFRDDLSHLSELQESGVSVFRGRGSLDGPGRVKVVAPGETPVLLTARDVVIATGSFPLVPAVPGLHQVPIWQSDDALSSDLLPNRLLVLGGGPVGCELAQIYRTFGADVTVVEAAPRLLPHEDPFVGELLRRAMETAGVTLHLGCAAERCQPRGSAALVTLTCGDVVEVDRLLLAVGRRPRVQNIGLETVGVEAADSALSVDDRCAVRGTERVWAAGDVTGRAPFTHVANYQGRVAAANLGGQELRADYRALPRTVYTDPAVAAVGLTTEGCRASGVDLVAEEFDLAQTGRASTEPGAAGRVRVLADRRSGGLVGAAAVGPDAQEWIGEAILAIRARVPVPLLAEVVHPFPTYSEAYAAALVALAPRLR